ncbi:VOC family protein [Mesorhizobium sp. SP-1A]|uniref:VOC family protein n=1 Tax=Mesorhizobium sp. SP-1A TaxID=3077840 RepID=UPI0028F74B4C|nr:VOC family protein [Mesorhizobium sp. SP-1A]
MSKISVALSLFVEHGRQKDAADFYVAAFGAKPIQAHDHEGQLMAVDLQLGTLNVSVVGANPKRQANSSLGGPFHPQSAGAVSASLRLTVDDLDAVFAEALAAGATVRNEIGLDDRGSRSAALFDPFGHMWGLSQREAEDEQLAA